MKKVLLVEDDEIMARMYKKIFSFGGFDVITANDGEDGFEKAQTIKPDLIILDVMMPKLNGLDLLEKLKSTQDLKAIPIVMLTNLNMDREIQKALKNGASLYLVKNEHEPKKVLEMVQKLLNQFT